MCIGKRQNTQPQIERLGAQRHLYSEAKRVFAWQIALVGPLSIVSAVIAIYSLEYAAYAALLGVVALVADDLWLDRRQERLREAAARVQENFDCDVLQLPWNAIKLGAERPDPELVKRHWDAYQPMRALMPPVEDWYELVVDDIPLPLGRLACQRSNVVWDAALRDRYASWMSGSVTVLFFLILLLGIYQGVQLGDLMIAVVLPLAPVVLLGIRYFRENRRAAKRLRKLKGVVQEAWSAALAGQTAEQTTAVSRALQDEIYENRRSSPVVFDWFYKRLRKGDQEETYYAVTASVEEAKRHRPQAHVNDGSTAKPNDEESHTK